MSTIKQNKYKIGQKVRVIHSHDVYIGTRDDGNTGYITCIDDNGTLFGTWGLGLIPGIDEFEIIDDNSR